MTGCESVQENDKLTFVVKIVNLNYYFNVFPPSFILTRVTEAHLVTLQAFSHKTPLHSGRTHFVSKKLQ